MGFLIHGRHARILARFLALDRRTGGGVGARVFGVRSEDRGGGGILFYSATETDKYSFAVLFLS